MNRQIPACSLARLLPWGTLHHSNRMIRHDAEDRRGYLGNASGATWPLVGCTAEKDHQSAIDHSCHRQSTAKLSNISVSLTSLNDQWQDWEVQWEQHPHQQIYHRPLESFESSKSPTPVEGMYVPDDHRSFNEPSQPPTQHNLLPVKR